MGIYENGEYMEVHPTFLYESILTFLIFILLIKMSNKRKYKGQIVLVYFINYSLARMIIEELRVDSLMIGDFRISQVLSLIIFLVATCIYFLKKKK